MKKLYYGHSFFGGLMLCMCIFAGVGCYDLYKGNGRMALAELLFAVLLLIYIAIVIVMRRRDMKEYMSMLVQKDDSSSHSAVNLLPVAAAVLTVDGLIMWFNDGFSKIAGSESLYNTPITDIIKDIKWTKVLKATDSVEFAVRHNDSVYKVIAKIAKTNREGGEISVILYFIDITRQTELERKYEDERTVVGLVAVDNYDEVFQKMDDSESQQASARINRIVTDWVSESDGVIKRLERDRYLVMFEKKYLSEYISKKFDVLEKVRQIGEEIRQPVSVSIGVGIGASLDESEEFSRAALDMAQGRGGDQAAVKDETQFKFYGGKTREYEKSTRVKTRAFAGAFKGFIKNCDKVVFMGHSNADYDCFGAAIGLSRACRDCGKNAYIVYDNSPAVAPLAKQMRTMPDYAKMLISCDHAREIVTHDTLLVILDTHRPSMLPEPRLLDATEKIVLIDHHRRSTEFLPHTSLLYHEPYASSTCEMSTEILQYIDTERTITPFEVKALYVGILMDTKNFMLKTGVRTFEAASYLRRYGLDLVEVKKLFTMDRGDYMHKIRIMETLEVYSSNIAIAHAQESYPNMRVVSSLAADDMLGISGIRAAFVVYEVDGEAYVSARSFGDINVQLICEKLGGGGHMTVAGAQMRGIGTEAALLEVKAAISEYIDETKNDK